MIRFLKSIRTSLVAAGLGIALIIVASVADIDLIKPPAGFLHGVKEDEFDELLAVFALLSSGILIDASQHHRRAQAELKATELRTLSDTMRAVEGIVNRFLHQLMLFELRHQSRLPPHSLDELDDLIQKTYEQLQSLGAGGFVPDRPPGTSSPN